MKVCSKCGRELDESCFSKAKKYKDGLQHVCKECNKIYKLEHRDKYLKYSKEYYMTHKPEIQEVKKRYRIRTIDKWEKYNKDYYCKNTDRILEQKKEYGNRNAKYEIYADKLTVDEEPRLSGDGVSLEVKCRYCGKYFIPTILQAGNRVKALNGTTSGESNLYCSVWCAESCPLYNQRTWPKGFKKASSREVPAILRQIVLKRDNYTCVYCGATTADTQIHCHHIQPAVSEPMFQADPENCISVCVD